jgi:hypothetical protein
MSPTTKDDAKAADAPEQQVSAGYDPTLSRQSKFATKAAGPAPTPPYDKPAPGPSVTETLHPATPGG